MYTARLAYLTGFLALVHGDALLDGKHRVAARQGDYGYGYPFPPFPVSTSPGSDPTTTSTFSLSTGASSGSAPGTISASGTTSGPYGNITKSLSGTAYSTGSPTYTSNDPNTTSTTVSGQPLPSYNASTSSSKSGDPTSYGTISATPVTASNATDPGYPYPTHGPYPFSSSRKSYDPSRTVGTGISTVANFTSLAPTDPSASRVYPTHGPYTRTSSLPPYSYSKSLTAGTIGPTVLTSDPSASLTVSANATTDPASSGTAPSYSSSLSASTSISVNVTSITPSNGTGVSSTILTTTSDPYVNATTSVLYYTLSTSIGPGTGTGDPFSVTASATTFDTSFKFTYKPTIKSQPSEYYYHHRKPHHASQVSHRHGPTTVNRS